MNISDLIAIVQKSRSIDPTLADILIGMLQEQARIAGIIDPAPIVESKVVVSKIAPAPDVQTFSYTFTDSNVILSWGAPSPVVLLYEIRQGTSWDTATRILTTATLSATLDPLVIGTTTYLIKALTSAGGYSVNALSLAVVVPAIPAFNVTSALLGNFVLLSWSEPVSTFKIDYYILSKGGVEFARIKSTFLTKQEFAGGTFTYSVIAVDIAGNQSASSSNTALVSAPSDFILKSEFESAFSGTKTNCKLGDDSRSLLVCIDTSTTYAHHFSNHGWASPAAQVAAGYPRWLSPFATTASYKEVFDIGTIYTNTVINLSYLYTIVAGAFTVGFSTRVSNDNISWSAANTNQVFFAASVRYIEVTANFTASNDKAEMQFYHFHIAVNVREEMDSGSISALSSDALGTVVTFNKAFKDVESITLDTQTVTREQFDTIYTFNDVPNPTGFNVFVYDSSGIRVSKTVRWKARGII